MLTRNDLVERLTKGKVNLQFTKTNGELRSMNCTLNSDMIPNKPEQKDPTKELSGRKVNENVVSVWDLDKNDWRSFRVDSIISVVES